ncbi:MAG: hypothetical protein JRJ71_14340 [Deltaproteobacteria bacterium]|nr:hypothetical protein [Deltaproteobacteria bacterium]
MYESKNYQDRQPATGKKEVYLYPGKRLLGQVLEQKGEKRCPFLEGKYNKRCRAPRFLFSPAAEHLDRYCENGCYAECGIYINHEAVKIKDKHNKEEK